MARHRPGPGRPSAGSRHAFLARVPETIADRVRAEADARDMSYSEYIAAVLGNAHGFTVDIPPRRTDVPEQGHLEGIGA